MGSGRSLIASLTIIAGVSPPASPAPDDAVAPWSEPNAPVSDGPSHPTTQASFTIPPIGTPAKAVLAAFALTTLTLAIVVLLQPIPLWVRLAGAVILFAVSGLLGYFLYGGLRGTAIVGTDAVRLNVPVYGRSIPRASIDTAGVRVINFGSSPHLRPRLRTNGLSVPGYHVGRFRLRNGSRAFATLTAMDRDVVYVPLLDGTAVLLSVEDPKGFATQLA